MEKRKKFIINFLYFAIIIAAIFFALQFALSLLFPFVAALFIAYILKHPINFIARKTKMPRKLAAILMVLIFYGTIGTFLVLASIRAFSFATDLVQRLPSIFRIYVNPVLTDLFDQLEQALEQAAEHLQQGKAQLLGAWAGELLAEELRLAQQNLSEITGEFTSDDLLGRIFSSFCIGK